MDGQRWWIVDEIARWWAQASEGERWLLMQRAFDGCEEATLAEVQQGAVEAELRDPKADDARAAIEAWSAGKGFGRR